ncbi:MAG: hypothetical protein R3F55_02795 [Alphaproteobacteria bacterium]
MTATTALRAAACLALLAAAPARADVLPHAVAPVHCDGLVLTRAFIAIPTAQGMTTLPMTPLRGGAFTIDRQPDWPAVGHIRLIWSPAADAPAGWTGAVDVEPDAVLLDGAVAADAFLGGGEVATAIQNVSLDPAAWPHQVSLQLGAVPAGSPCAAFGAAPVTLTVTDGPGGLRPFGPGFGTVSATPGTPLPSPVPAGRLQPR